MYRPDWVHFLRGEEVAILRSRIESHEAESGRRARLLEVGSGDGYMGSLLIKCGFEVVCTDPQPRDPRHCEIIETTSDELPFADDEFDVIFSSNVLEHIENLDAALAEQTRVLKPGGLMIHSVPGVWCSFFTTATFPIHYLRSLVWVASGRHPQQQRLRRPLHKQSFWRKVAKKRPWLRKPIEALTPFARIGNPWGRCIRTDGHGIATNPLQELQQWRAKVWKETFRRNRLPIREIVPHPVAYSMCKIFGLRFLWARRALAKAGCPGDLVFVIRYGA